MALHRTMGFLIAAGERDWRKYINAFENELRDNWVVNGRGHGPDKLTIDYQPEEGAAGDQRTFANIANTFEKDKVDIIVTSGTKATQACMNVPNIPIVFAAAGDPVGSGLVTTLAAPGGRVTGCTNLQTDGSILDNRIALMMRGRPKTDKVGVVGNIDCNPVNTAIDVVWGKLNNAGIPVVSKALGRFTYADFQNAATIRNKLTAMQDGTVTVLYVCSDPVLTANLDVLVPEAKILNMETMHEIREARDRNGHQTYGANFRLLFTKAAEKANQILRTGTIPPVFVPDPSAMEQDPP
jgi:putative ABC transport system substrate-binding protein